nr:hypothetical protein BaRGS_018533 [Batillaria attramentaria]
MSQDEQEPSGNKKKKKKVGGRHTSVSKHKQSQALKRKNPDPPHTTNVNELSSSIHTLDFTSYKKPLVTAARANSLQSFVANTGIKHPSADGNEEEKDLYGIIGLAASLDSLILSDHDLWYRKLKRLT